MKGILVQFLAKGGRIEVAFCNRAMENDGYARSHTSPTPQSTIDRVGVCGIDRGIARGLRLCEGNNGSENLSCEITDGMLRRRGERQQPAGVDKSQQEATATDNERDATSGGGAVGQEAMARRQGMIMGGQRTRKKQQRNNQIGRPNNQTPTSANTGDWIRHEPTTTMKQACNNHPLQLLRVERKTMWKR